MAVENRTDFCKFVVGDGKQLSNPSFWPEYKELLIGGMGLVGTLFIVSVYGMKVGFVHEKKDLFSEISHIFYEIGIAGILIIFPFIVIPFSLIFGIIVFVIVITWICLYIYYHRSVIITKLRSHRP